MIKYAMRGDVISWTLGRQTTASLGKWGTILTNHTSGLSSPPYQCHRRKRGNDCDGVGYPIPEIAISVHERQGLNQFDRSAEGRKRNSKHEQSAPRERRHRQQSENIKGGEVLRLVSRGKRYRIPRRHHRLDERE
jgi:hypothetical protein